jgi:hypothetical protein
MPVPLNTNGYELIFQKTYKGLQASFYYTRPTREVIYRFGPLTLLDFEVQSDSTIAPGETLWLTSWWSLDQPLQDNYWLSAALIDPMGRPQAGADGLLGDSFTGMWKARSLHMDRRKIRLPVTIPSGNYNLVLVMHGTVRDTANLLITLADDSPVGRYGYLTTITVP